MNGTYISQYFEQNKFKILISDYAMKSRNISRMPFTFPLLTCTCLRQSSVRVLTWMAKWVDIESIKYKNNLTARMEHVHVYMTFLNIHYITSLSVKWNQYKR